MVMNKKDILKILKLYTNYIFDYFSIKCYSYSTTLFRARLYRTNWQLFFDEMKLFLIFVTETISKTDEDQPRPKYIFNKCGTNIYFFTHTEVWSITIAPNLYLNDVFEIFERCS